MTTATITTGSTQLSIQRNWRTGRTGWTRHPLTWRSSGPLTIPGMSNFSLSLSTRLASLKGYIVVRTLFHGDVIILLIEAIIISPGWTVKSSGTFQFGAVGTDTYCRETIYYQCPPFLGPYCRNEVEFQRRAIMENLSSHMSNRFKMMWKCRISSEIL